jgi:hypothetical protein
LGLSWQDARLRDIAILDGQPQRLSGRVSFPALPEPARVLFENDPERVLEQAYPAGDLDGDGAADVFSVSSHHLMDGSGYVTEGTQLHVHYGQLAAPVSPPLR